MSIVPFIGYISIYFYMGTKSAKKYVEKYFEESWVSRNVWFVYAPDFYPLCH